MEVSDITDNVKSYPLTWGCAFVCLLIGGYLYFTFGSLAELEESLFEYEKEDRVLKTNFREGGTLESDLELLKAGFEQIESRLIDSDQIANNNGYFYDFAKNYDVEVFSVSQGAVMRQSGKPSAAQLWTLKHYPVIPFEMEVVGLLTDIMSFLYGLDQCDRFVRIREFDLSVDPRKEPGYMRMNLEINVIGKPPEKKGAKK